MHIQCNNSSKNGKGQGYGNGKVYVAIGCGHGEQWNVAIGIEW
jgi:hypothetical protein